MRKPNWQEETDDQWNMLYDFMLKCGNEHDPYHFCGTIAREMCVLIPYDEARVIFLDSNGKIRSSLLYGVDSRNWERFLEYYSEGLTGSKYSLKEPLHLSENEKVSLCDWTDLATRRAHDLFESSYVRELQLKYCLGMGLCDNCNCIRCIITFDRVRNLPYTDGEVRMLKKLRPLLDNYFINFFTEQTYNLNQQDFLLSQYFLTDREREIAKLMIEGSAPKSISERLCISVNTVYKHIANMYKKMHVSNRQEFMARMSGY